MTSKIFKTLVVCSVSNATRTISYHQGWLNNLLAHPSFECSLLNLAQNFSFNIAKLNLWKLFLRFDAIIVLHSTFANTNQFSPEIIDRIRAMDTPLTFFIGNEYKLIPEKLDLARALGVDLFISQSTSEEVLELYRAELSCRVTGIPSAGLDPDIFYPKTEYDNRPIDIGFRGADEPVYFGHQDRKRIASYFLDQAAGLGLVVDISYNEPEKRFSQSEYADFLNRCKAQLGTESGGNYFQLSDELRNRIVAHIQSGGDADEQTIQQKFFDPKTSAIPCRIISGRVAEAAGTKTLQILFEGEYGGLIEPDNHYLALKKDFSNIDEVMRKFRDRGLVDDIIRKAYEMAMENLTYRKLIDRLYGELTELI